MFNLKLPLFELRHQLESQKKMFLQSYMVKTCCIMFDLESNESTPKIAMLTCYVRLVGIVPKFDQYSKAKTEV